VLQVLDYPVADKRAVAVGLSHVLLIPFDQLPSFLQV